MIPKLLHLIWIGPHEPPWACIETWRTELVRAHPGWQARLWREQDLEELPLRNREAYERTASLCGKADIARYEIVHRHGGVYVDADSVWLGRPLEPVLAAAERSGFFGALEGAAELMMCGFFGAVAGHPLLEAAISMLPARLDALRGEPQWVLTGPGLLGAAHQQLLRETLPSEPPSAALIPFERLVAMSWRGLTAAALPALIAHHRREGEALSLQLGYTTNALWGQELRLGDPGDPGDTIDR
jgi:inositol phosphorylceramide mannosyltransferase catalytic subunit